MSGHYPPHNPYGSHPQRTPASPWAHPRHPQTHMPGMVWTPHVGMWAPKPQPLYGLPMMPQQEETMDLSSSAQFVDPLHNGTVNGETSVIAANPINCTKRPSENAYIPPVVPEKTVVETVLKINQNDLDRLSELNFSGSTIKNSEEVQSSESEFKNVRDVSNAETSTIHESQSYLENSYLSAGTDESRLVVAESSTEDIFGMSSVDNMNNLTPQEDQHSNTIPSPEKPEASRTCLSPKHSDPPADNLLSQQSEQSTITLSSQESVQSTVCLSSSQQSERSTVCLSSELSGSSISVLSSSRETVFQKSTENSSLQIHTQSFTPERLISSEKSIAQSQKKTSTPDPSIENVEILLESMFNSQEETCSNLQSVSGNGLPQTVIVPNGTKLPVENTKPLVELSVKEEPMKEEELAKTLAEDTITEFDEVDKNQTDPNHASGETPSNDIICNVKEEQTSVIICNVPDIPVSNDNKTKDDINYSISELNKSDCGDNKIQVETVDVKPPVDNVIESTDEIDHLTVNRFQSKDIVRVMPTDSVTSSSSNPFIEVESELEKMFAGIVEPVEDANSDSPAQPSCSKLVSNKKTTRKRKRANSRRPSDNSVLEGSSGDGTMFKKKFRKSVSGYEKSSKKIKTDNGDTLKKGKVLKENGSDVLSGKVKGPFLHIEGTKESPASVVLVNSGSRVDEEEVGEKPSARKRSKDQKREGGVQKSRSSYSASTLSMRYNADTADSTWVCVFCKRGPHCVGGEPSGDLFGPYRVPLSPPTNDMLPSGTPMDKDIAEEQKRGSGGKYPKSLRACGPIDTSVLKRMKAKRSASLELLDQPGLLPVGDCYEVWLHEQCAVWAPGLILIGSQLVGLDSVIWTALRTRCWHCGVAGAELGCVVHNCPTKMHYPCAKLAGWLLEHDSFIARCHSHRTRLRP